MGVAAGKPRRAALVVAVALATGAGCGGDEPPPSGAGTTGHTGSTGVSGATGVTGAEGASIDLEAARESLESAGFSVEEQAGDDLVQETAAGSVEAIAGYRVFEPGSSADVVIQRFEASDDADAVASSLETGFFAVEVRGDVLLFSVGDQEDLLDEVTEAAS